MKKLLLTLTAGAFALASSLNANIIDDMKAFVSGKKDTAMTEKRSGKMKTGYKFGSPADRVERWKKVTHAFNSCRSVHATNNDKMWAEHNLNRAKSAQKNPISKYMKQRRADYRKAASRSSRTARA